MTVRRDHYKHEIKRQQRKIQPIYSSIFSAPSIDLRPYLNPRPPTIEYHPPAVADLPKKKERRTKADKIAEEVPVTPNGNGPQSAHEPSHGDTKSHEGRQLIFDTRYGPSWGWYTASDYQINKALKTGHPDFRIMPHSFYEQRSGTGTWLSDRHSNVFSW